MMESSTPPAVNTAWVDHIPVLWLEPARRALIHRLAIFLPYLSGSKERMLPYLEALTAAGQFTDAHLHPIERFIAYNLLFTQFGQMQLNYPSAVHTACGITIHFAQGPGCIGVTSSSAPLVWR